MTRIKTHRMGLAAILLALVSGAASAQGQGAVAQDDASHYDKAGGYNTQANSGTGFADAFSVSNTNKQGGQFLGDSNGNGFLAGPGINSGSTTAFGLYMGESATRHLKQPVASGQTFSVAFDNGLVDTGASDSLEFLDASGKAVVTFEFKGGGQDYLLNGQDTGLKFTDGGLTVALTPSGTDACAVRVKRLSDGAAQTFTEKLPAGAHVGGIRITNGNPVGGAPHDLFFNSLSVASAVRP